MNRLKKGDNVIITKGKDKGKKGKILKVYPQTERILVEKVNLAKKHKKAAGNEQAAIIDKLLPMHWSNAKLICPRTSKPTKITFTEVDGQRKRKAVVSSEIIG